MNNDAENIQDLLPVRAVRGEGALAHVGELAAELSGTRVLVVTDPGVARTGYLSRVFDAIGEAGLAVAVFDRVVENPTTEVVNDCVAAARQQGADLLVALGGGSSIDTAKGCNFVYTNGGEMKDYWGQEKAGRPMLPLIAIPTTAGTGSEFQRFALIGDAVTHHKMACGDREALPSVVILDPTLTVTQPPRVTAATGMDALVHAVETAVTRDANERSLACSHKAFALLHRNLDTVMRKPDDLAARGAMQTGAALAGAAIEYSMLGATHSAANPLTARYNVVHGQAVGIMLPHLVRFNAEAPRAAQGYLNLAIAGGLCKPGAHADEAVERIVARLTELLAATELLKPLAKLGVEVDHIPDLAQEAAEQWTAQFNPRPVAVADFAGLYESAC